jgi:DNA-binding MarR family transcriptional regulator
VARSPAPPTHTAADTVALAATLEARLTDVWAVLMSGTSSPLSRTAAAVLGNLRDVGPLRVTDLARLESVAQPTMTTIVARLRREGLVDAVQDPTDARASLLSVTDAGRAALQERVQARAALLAERLAHLEDVDRAAIAGALDALDALVPERPAGA